MIGEGYIDEITLDNLHSIVPENSILLDDGSIADDDVEGMKSS